MNEIEKLKTEHARYRKALEKLDGQGLPHAERHRIIDCALNPPPVTLDELKAALAKFREPNGLHSINFFRDESGGIENQGGDRVFSFRTLRQAVDWLTR